MIVSNDGVKGGSGKSVVAYFAVACLFDGHPLVIDTDTGNTDVALCYEESDNCDVRTFDLGKSRDLFGMNEAVASAIGDKRDVVINWGARNEGEASRLIPGMAAMCGEAGTDVVVLWVVGRDQVSLRQLRDFMEMMSSSGSMNVRICLIKNLHLVQGHDESGFNYVSRTSFRDFPSVFFPSLYEPIMDCIRGPNWWGEDVLLERMSVGARFLSRGPIEAAKNAVREALRIAMPLGDLLGCMGKARVANAD